MLNTEKLKKFMELKGWNEPMLAAYLEIDYSYLYRVLRGKRNPGGKFFLGIVKLCQREELDIHDFIQI